MSYLSILEGCLIRIFLNIKLLDIGNGILNFIKQLLFNFETPEKSIVNIVIYGKNLL